MKRRITEKKKPEKVRENAKIQKVIKTIKSHRVTVTVAGVTAFAIITGVVSNVNANKKAETSVATTTAMSETTKSDKTSADLTTTDQETIEAKGIDNPKYITSMIVSQIPFKAMPSLELANSETSNTKGSAKDTKTKGNQKSKSDAKPKGKDKATTDAKSTKQEETTHEVFADPNQSTTTPETNDYYYSETEYYTSSDECYVYGTDAPYENHLTKNKGVSKAPNGYKETYYDLNMSGIVSMMRHRGYSAEEYPYYVDEVRGTKMLGDYIMVAADLKQYSRGDIVETDLGSGIVCDTGGFTRWNRNCYDIAVNWNHGYYPGYNG